LLASFCLYMTHLMINGEMFNYFRSKVDLNSFGDVVLYLALVVVVCVVVASLLYSFYEKPMNNVLTRLLGKKIIKPPMGTPA
jgi:peptidoglycan/LPS O-acetylase OafA/YrhL